MLAACRVPRIRTVLYHASERELVRLVGEAPRLRLRLECSAPRSRKNIGFALSVSIIKQHRVRGGDGSAAPVSPRQRGVLGGHLDGAAGLFAAQAEGGRDHLGFGRILALHRRPSAIHRMHSEIRRLCF